MNRLTRSAALGALLAISSIVAAAGPEGKWNGKLLINFPAMPNATPEMKAKMDQAKAQLQKAVIALDLKADKSYVVKASGGPSASGNTETGTWTLVGSKLTLKSSKDGEKKMLTLSGKTMVMMLPGGQGKIVFRR